VPGDSTSSTSTFASQARRTVGRYDILQEIGQGGMATVYLARHIDLDRQVALKELGLLRASDPSFVRRFVREAQLAGSLSHPNIVTVYDYFEHEGAPYIAMEYIKRGSLRPYVGGMSQAQVGGALRDVLAGLAAAEKHQIVHRDLKPENLMVTDEGGVKIADFGIAKATNELKTGAFMTSTGVAVGTPNYISPEQARAQKVGPWTDLYAVGMMAFEFFVGSPPFADTDEAMAVLLRQVNDPIPMVSDLDPSVDRRMSRWIEWLVSKKPSDRPQSAADAWEELEETLEGWLGPRWSRDAQLLEPGERSSPSPAPPVPTAALSQVSTNPLDDPEMARTLPPTRRRPPIDQPAEPAGAKPRRKPRWRSLVIATMAVVATLAAIAAAMSPRGVQSGGTQEAAQTSPAAGSSGASGQSGTLSSLQNAPQPSSAPTKKQLARQSRTAFSLASNYQDTASRIDALGSGPGANPQLVAALRQTGSAYQAAGTAAAAGDSAGYTAAIASANDGKTAISGALAGDTGNSAGGSQQAGGSSQESCAGDSQSDDPSDDSCDGP
jgi:serine/threonine protein kinase